MFSFSIIYREVIGGVVFVEGNKKSFLLLHGILCLYSCGAIVSKTAAQKELFSIEFLVLYGIVLCNLGIYAIAWQKVLKNVPLNIAYANKAITVIWGMIWGFLFFKENITIQKVLGALIIIVATIMIVKSDNVAEQEE